MKKILFITYSFSLGGGSEKILSNILNGLADKTDYDVSVLEYAKYDIKSERINSKIKSLNPIVDMNKSSSFYVFIFAHGFFAHCILKKNTM